MNEATGEAQLQGAKESVVCSSCGETQAVAANGRRGNRKLRRLGWKRSGEIALCPDCRRRASELSRSLSVAAR
jgi:hypothetical protein